MTFNVRNPLQHDSADRLVAVPLHAWVGSQVMRRPVVETCSNQSCSRGKLVVPGASALWLGARAMHNKNVRSSDLKLQAQRE